MSFTRRTFLGALAAPAIIRAADACTCTGTGGGPGPAASSSFITADFSNLTSPNGVANVTVYPQLFGAGTGGMGNNNFAPMNNATLITKVRALNLPLWRQNANWMGGGTGGLSTFATKIGTAVPSTCTMVIGVTGQSQSISGTWKSSAAVPCLLWEWLNESGLPNSTYNSGFASHVAGLQATDASYKGAGNVNAGLDVGGLQSLIGSTTSSKLGLLDWHEYLWCSGPDAPPSNAEVCLGLMNGASQPKLNGDQINAQNGVSATFASGLPMLIGEYNVECSASNSDMRAGTSIGAAFMVSSTLARASVSTQPAWGAMWDIYDDASDAYNMIDFQNNLLPQYYCLQRLIAKMPGLMVNSSIGATAAGMTAWATKNATALGLAIVNSNSTAKSGQVALSHWPANGNGNGTATLWTYPTSPGLSAGTDTNPPVVNNVPGNTSSVAVTAGLTASITVPAFSTAILSVP